MKRSTRLLSAVLLLTPLALYLQGCGCGFDCNNGNNNDEPTLLTLGFSDALPEELKQVVITVDSITLGRSGADDVVIDRFTIDELDLTDADTFQMDLLDYRGVNQLLVLEDVPLDKDTYSNVSIAILDGDINTSYVQESDDTLKEIAVTESLVLPGLSLSGSEQHYTVEFSLAQSLYQENTDTYRLFNEGIRVENAATAASLTGVVDAELFDAVTPCDEKLDPEAGNRLYLFTGRDLNNERLGDVFTDNSTPVIPPNTQAPFAVASLQRNSLTGNWDYAFGYLPAGDYTLAFSCDTFDDDAIDFNDLTIPLPEGQVYELTLAESEQQVCNVSVDSDC